MQTLLGMTSGEHGTHTALIGGDTGQISVLSIASEVIGRVDRFFASPRYVAALVVRLPIISYPTPDYGLSIHPPIDIDRMIEDVMNGRKRVTAYSAMPTMGFRDLQLEAYESADRHLRVYCVFDPVERVWYVYH